MDDYEYSLVRDRVYWGAGVDKGSPAEQKLDVYFGNLRSASSVLNSAGFNLEEKGTQSEAIQAMSVVTQGTLRKYPKESRIGFDFGDDKTNYLVKAYEDIVSGRADSIKGEYQYSTLIGKPSSKLAEVMRSTYDPIALLDRVDRIFTLPWAAGMGAIVEMHQNAGGSEESAAALYKDLMENVDIVSLVGEIAVGGATAIAKTPKLAAKAKGIGKAISNFVTKHGAADTVRKEHLERVVSKSAFKTWIDYKRGLQVVQPATMVRNTVNVAVMRTGIDGVAEAAAYGMSKSANAYRQLFYGKLLGKEVQPVAHMTAKQIGTNARAMVHYMGQKKYRQFVRDVTSANPDAVDTLFTRYVGDLEKGGANAPAMQKVVDFLNTPNWVQEQFNRSVQFMASLDNQLISKGVSNGVDDIIDATGKVVKGGISEEMIAKAADDALYWTFAKEPTGFGKNVIDWMNRSKIGNILLATDLPYPRFITNAWKHFTDLSPHKALKVAKLFGNKPVSAMELKEIGNGMAGAALTATMFEMEKLGILGDDWSKVTLGGQTFDAKPLLGPYAPYALAGHALARYEKGELDMDLSHLISDIMDSFNAVPNSYDIGLPQAAEGMTALIRAGILGDFDRNGKEVLQGTYSTGNPEMDDAVKKITTFISKTLSGYTVPLQVGSDLISVFDEDERIAREMTKSPNPVNISPLVGKIPVLKRILPPKQSQTRSGPVVMNNGWMKQVSGLTSVDANFFERELKSLGFSRQETTYTPLGSAYYDYLMEGRTGEYVEGMSNWLAKDPKVLIQLDKDIDPFVQSYSKLKPREKAEFMRNLIIAARDFADLDVRTKLVAEGRTDVLQTIKQSKISQRKVAAMREHGYDFNEMDISEGTLTSPMWVRDNLKFYNIMPEDKFTPAPKGK